MGFFKKVKNIFSETENWQLAHYYYGDEIARELRSLPNSEPFSLMTEKEKAALRVIQLTNKLYMLEDRSMTRTSDEEKKKRSDAVREAQEVLGDDFIVNNQAFNNGLNNQWNQEKSERAKFKWKRRLEYYKIHGSVEKDWS